MAKAMGFESYEEMRQPFRDFVRKGMGTFPDRARWLQLIARGGSHGQLYSQMAAASLTNIEQVYSGTSANEMRAVADLIIEARTVYILGAGIGFSLAHFSWYLAHTAWITRFTSPASAFFRSTTLPGYAALVSSHHQLSGIAQESLRALAKRYRINPKTVAKWKKRGSLADLPTGPRDPKSTVLSLEEEAIVVAFRKHTLLLLDDCLYALQATFPHLTRSSLHRCLQRHGINRLPDTKGDKPDRRKFKTYPIGYFHIDIAEDRTEDGKLYLFVAIDRTSKFAFAELVEKANTKAATAFLDALVDAVSYKIHTVLADNGIQFADLPKNRNGPTAKLRGHPFDRACRLHDIEHRLTKPNHPWTNGQVERMNRTIKDAAAKRYHYDSHDRLRIHLRDFMAAYNFAKRLKTLKGLTPYQYICKTWTNEPERFRLNPLHQMPGLNT